MKNSAQVKDQIRVGVIGSGYMGKGFALAIGSVDTLFGLSVSPVKEVIAASSPESGRRAANELGFSRWADHWTDVVADPNVDAIINCTPNHLHRDIAIAALEAGKPILSEKPLGRNAKEVLDMVEAAAKTNLTTMAGYTYMKNPATSLAKEMVEAGEIGDVVHFRGTHIEEFFADPNLPVSWRMQKEQAGSGALGDLGHIINMAHYLCGEVSEIVADLQTVIPQRPDGVGNMVDVDTDDQAHMLCRFASGALGYLELSRVAVGQKMGLTYEITGTKGTILFDQARMSELKVFLSSDDHNREGFRTILLGPEHPDYGNFNAGAGHGLGYNDMIAIEVRDFILGVVEKRQVWPNFADAYHTEQIIDAAMVSSSERQWVSIPGLSIET